MTTKPKEGDAMTEAPPVENHPCSGCGQLDDHPMIHVAGVWEKDADTIIRNPSFHFDCLPPVFEQLLDGPQHATTVSAIAAARSGVQGTNLRAHIAAQPNDNLVEPETSEV